MAKKKNIFGEVQPVQIVWLSSADTRTYLGNCSPNWLQKLRDEDLIRFTIVKGRYLYELKSLEKLLQSNKV